MDDTPFRGILRDHDPRRNRVVLMCPAGREPKPDDGLSGLCETPPAWQCVVVALAYALGILAFGAAAALAFCLAASAARGAPAPAYRAPVPLDKRIEGGHVMTWGTAQGTCYVSPQGFWGCELGGTHWHGEWSLEGETLTIREQRLDWPDAAPVTYRVTLDPARLPGGGIRGAVGGPGGKPFELRER